MNRNSSLVSMTARTAYKRVKVISEAQTSPADTLGETPLAVVMSPKTIHGWRPVSVKIQPKLLANNGSSGVARIVQNHRRWRGMRSRRVDHNTADRKSTRLNSQSPM